MAITTSSSISVKPRRTDRDTLMMSLAGKKVPELYAVGCLEWPTFPSGPRCHPKGARSILHL
jgi:hypothetical protein